MLIQYDKRTLHQQDCPWFRCSRVQWSLGVQLVLPKLLARSLHAIFSATYGAGGYTLAPTFTAVRIVDWKNSSTFRTIDIAREEIQELGCLGIEDCFAQFSFSRLKCRLSKQQRLSKTTAILEKVQSELQSSFYSGEASPSDQDATGFTLLHVSQIMKQFTNVATYR